MNRPNIFLQLGTTRMGSSQQGLATFREKALSLNPGATGHKPGAPVRDISLSAFYDPASGSPTYGYQQIVDDTCQGDSLLTSRCNFFGALIPETKKDGSLDIADTDSPWSMTAGEREAFAQGDARQEELLVDALLDGGLLAHTLEVQEAPMLSVGAKPTHFDIHPFPAVALTVDPTMSLPAKDGLHRHIASYDLTSLYHLDEAESTDAHSTLIGWAAHASSKDILGDDGLVVGLLQHFAKERSGSTFTITTGQLLELAENDVQLADNFAFSLVVAKQMADAIAEPDRVQARWARALDQRLIEAEAQLTANPQDSNAQRIQNNLRAAFEHLPEQAQKEGAAARYAKYNPKPATPKATTLQPTRTQTPDAPLMEPWQWWMSGLDLVLVLALIEKRTAIARRMMGRFIRGLLDRAEPAKADVTQTLDVSDLEAVTPEPRTEGKKPPPAPGTDQMGEKTAVADTELVMIRTWRSFLDGPVLGLPAQKLGDLKALVDWSVQVLEDKKDRAKRDEVTEPHYEFARHTVYAYLIENLARATPAAAYERQREGSAPDERRKRAAKIVCAAIDSQMDEHGGANSQQAFEAHEVFEKTSDEAKDMARRIAVRAINYVISHQEGKGQGDLKDEGTHRPRPDNAQKALKAVLEAWDDEVSKDTTLKNTTRSNIEQALAVLAVLNDQIQIENARHVAEKAGTFLKNCLPEYVGPDVFADGVPDDPVQIFRQYWATFQDASLVAFLGSDAKWDELFEKWVRVKEATPTSEGTVKARPRAGRALVLDVATVIARNPLLRREKDTDIPDMTAALDEFIEPPLPESLSRKLALADVAQQRGIGVVPIPVAEETGRETTVAVEPETYYVGRGQETYDTVPLPEPRVGADDFARLEGHCAILNVDSGGSFFIHDNGSEQGIRVFSPFGSDDVPARYERVSLRPDGASDLLDGDFVAFGRIWYRFEIRTAEGDRSEDCQVGFGHFRALEPAEEHWVHEGLQAFRRVRSFPLPFSRDNPGRHSIGSQTGTADIKLVGVDGELAEEQCHLGVDHQGRMLVSIPEGPATRFKSIGAAATKTCGTYVVRGQEYFKVTARWSELQEDDVLVFGYEEAIDLGRDTLTRLDARHAYRVQPANGDGFHLIYSGTMEFVSRDELSELPPARGLRGIDFDDRFHDSARLVLRAENLDPDDVSTWVISQPDNNTRLAVSDDPIHAYEVLDYLAAQPFPLDVGSATAGSDPTVTTRHRGTIGRLARHFLSGQAAALTDARRGDRPVAQFGAFDGLDTAAWGQEGNMAVDVIEGVLAKDAVRAALGERPVAPTYADIMAAYTRVRMNDQVLGRLAAGQELQQEEDRTMLQACLMTILLPETTPVDDDPFVGAPLAATGDDDILTADEAGAEIDDAPLGRIQDLIPHVQRASGHHPRNRIFPELLQVLDHARQKAADLAAAGTKERLRINELLDALEVDDALKVRKVAAWFGPMREAWEDVLGTLPEATVAVNGRSLSVEDCRRLVTRAESYRDALAEEDRVEMSPLDAQSLLLDVSRLRGDIANQQGRAEVAAAVHKNLLALKTLMDSRHMELNLIGGEETVRRAIAFVDHWPTDRSEASLDAFFEAFVRHVECREAIVILEFVASSISQGDGGAVAGFGAVSDSLTTVLAAVWDQEAHPDHEALYALIARLDDMSSSQVTDCFRREHLRREHTAAIDTLQDALCDIGDDVQLSAPFTAALSVLEAANRLLAAANENMSDLTGGQEEYDSALECVEQIRRARGHVTGERSFADALAYQREVPHHRFIFEGVTEGINTLDSVCRLIGTHYPRLRARIDDALDLSAAAHDRLEQREPLDELANGRLEAAAALTGAVRRTVDQDPERFSDEALRDPDTARAFLDAFYGEAGALGPLCQAYDRVQAVLGIFEGERPFAPTGLEHPLVHRRVEQARDTLQGALRRLENEEAGVLEERAVERSLQMLGALGRAAQTITEGMLIEEAWLRDNAAWAERLRKHREQYDRWQTAAEQLDQSVATLDTQADLQALAQSGADALRAACQTLIDDPDMSIGDVAKAHSEIDTATATHAIIADVLAIDAEQEALKALCGRLESSNAAHGIVRRYLNGLDNELHQARETALSDYSPDAATAVVERAKATRSAVDAILAGQDIDVGAQHAAPIPNHPPLQDLQRRYRACTRLGQALADLAGWGRARQAAPLRPLALALLDEASAIITRERDALVQDAETWPIEAVALAEAEARVNAMRGVQAVHFADATQAQEQFLRTQETDPRVAHYLDWRELPAAMEEVGRFFDAALALDIQQARGRLDDGIGALANNQALGEGDIPAVEQLEEDATLGLACVWLLDSTPETLAQDLCRGDRPVAQSAQTRLAAAELARNLRALRTGRSLREGDWQEHIDAGIASLERALETLRGEGDHTLSAEPIQKALELAAEAYEDLATVDAGLVLEIAEESWTYRDLLGHLDRVSRTWAQVSSDDWRSELRAARETLRSLQGQMKEGAVDPAGVTGGQAAVERAVQVAIEVATVRTAQALSDGPRIDWDQALTAQVLPASDSLIAHGAILSQANPRSPRVRRLIRGALGVVNHCHNIDREAPDLKQFSNGLASLRAFPTVMAAAGAAARDMESDGSFHGRRFDDAFAHHLPGRLEDWSALALAEENPYSAGDREGLSTAHYTLNGFMGDLKRPASSEDKSRALYDVVYRLGDQTRAWYSYWSTHVRELRPSSELPDFFDREYAEALEEVFRTERAQWKASRSSSASEPLHEMVYRALRAAGLLEDDLEAVEADYTADGQIPYPSEEQGTQVYSLGSAGGSARRLICPEGTSAERYNALDDQAPWCALILDPGGYVRLLNASDQRIQAHILRSSLGDARLEHDEVLCVESGDGQSLSHGDRLKQGDYLRLAPVSGEQGAVWYQVNLGESGLNFQPLEGQTVDQLDRTWQRLIVGEGETLGRSFAFELTAGRPSRFVAGRSSDDGVLTLPGRPRDIHDRQFEFAHDHQGQLYLRATGGNYEEGTRVYVQRGESLFGIDARQWCLLQSGDQVHIAHRRTEEKGYRLSSRAVYSYSRSGDGGLQHAFAYQGARVQRRTDGPVSPEEQAIPDFYFDRAVFSLEAARSIAERGLDPEQVERDLEVLVTFSATNPIDLIDMTTAPRNAQRLEWVTEMGIPELGQGREAAAMAQTWDQLPTSVTDAFWNEDTVAPRGLHYPESFLRHYFRERMRQLLVRTQGGNFPLGLQDRDDALATLMAARLTCFVKGQAMTGAALPDDVSALPSWQEELQRGLQEAVTRQDPVEIYLNAPDRKPADGTAKIKLLKSSSMIRRVLIGKGEAQEHVHIDSVIAVAPANRDALLATLRSAVVSGRKTELYVREQLNGHVIETLAAGVLSLRGEGADCQVVLSRGTMDRVFPIGNVIAVLPANYDGLERQLEGASDHSRQIYITGYRKPAGKVTFERYGETTVVKLTDASGGVHHFPVEQVVSFRRRHPDFENKPKGAAESSGVRQRAVDLTRLIVHPCIEDPQFPDLGFNQSGEVAKTQATLVDAQDTRLLDFIERHIYPLYARLHYQGESELAIYNELHRLVARELPYIDGYRPPVLRMLGEFLEPDVVRVCNERAQIVAVCRQFLGIAGRMEKGDVGRGRHAWDRAYPLDANGTQVEVLGDPPVSQADSFQATPVTEANRVQLDGIYQVDSQTPWVQAGGMGTLRAIAVGDGDETTGETEFEMPALRTERAETTPGHRTDDEPTDLMPRDRDPAGDVTREAPRAAFREAKTEKGPGRALAANAVNRTPPPLPKASPGAVDEDLPFAEADASGQAAAADRGDEIEALFDGVAPVTAVRVADEIKRVEGLIALLTWYQERPDYAAGDWATLVDRVRNRLTTYQARLLEEHEPRIQPGADDLVALHSRFFEVLARACEVGITRGVAGVLEARKGYIRDGRDDGDTLAGSPHAAIDALVQEMSEQYGLSRTGRERLESHLKMRWDSLTTGQREELVGRIPEELADRRLRACRLLLNSDESLCWETSLQVNSLEKERPSVQRSARPVAEEPDSAAARQRAGDELKELQACQELLQTVSGRLDPEISFRQYLESNHGHLDQRAKGLCAFASGSGQTGPLPAPSDDCNEALAAARRLAAVEQQTELMQHPNGFRQQYQNFVRGVEDRMPVARELDQMVWGYIDGLKDSDSLDRVAMRDELIQRWQDLSFAERSWLLETSRDTDWAEFYQGVIHYLTGRWDSHDWAAIDPKDYFPEIDFALLVDTSGEDAGLVITTDEQSKQGRVLRDLARLPGLDRALAQRLRDSADFLDQIVEARGQVSEGRRAEFDRVENLRLSIKRAEEYQPRFMRQVAWLNDLAPYLLRGQAEIDREEIDALKGDTDFGWTIMPVLTFLRENDRAPELAVSIEEYQEALNTSNRVAELIAARAILTRLSEIHGGLRAVEGSASQTRILAELRNALGF